MTDLRKVQMCQLDAVLEIDRICKKYNIKYVLIGGSLLGAVRHKGFIPWDDDLDIGMLREDYQKFLEICKKKNILNKKYSIQNWDNCKNYGLGYTKLRINGTHYVEKNSRFVKINDGIFVDIFPYDNFFNSEKMVNQKIKKLNFWRRLHLYSKGYKSNEETFIKNILRRIIMLLNILNISNFSKKKICKICQSGEATSNRLINYFGCYKERDILLRSSFDNIIRAEFEGYKLAIPKCYEENLKIIYGDYMTPPPLNKRENRHGILKIDFGLYVPTNKTYWAEIGKE